MLSKHLYKLTILIIDKTKRKDSTQTVVLWTNQFDLQGEMRWVWFIWVVLLVCDIISNQSSFLCFGEEVL